MRGTQRRDMEGDVMGKQLETVMEKNYAATGGLQPLEDLHWSKDQ